jgi:hypothetical protein
LSLFKRCHLGEGDRSLTKLDEVNTNGFRNLSQGAQEFQIDSKSFQFMMMPKYLQTIPTVNANATTITALYKALCEFDKGRFNLVQRKIEAISRTQVPRKIGSVWEYSRKRTMISRISTGGSLGLQMEFDQKVLVHAQKATPISER